MKGRKRRRPKRRDRNGHGIEWFAAREAYHDACYALLLDQFERYMRDPKRQERVGRVMRELLEDILKDLPE